MVALSSPFPGRVLPERVAGGDGNHDWYFFAQRRGGAAKRLAKSNINPIHNRFEYGMEVGLAAPFSAPPRLCAKNNNNDGIACIHERPKSPKEFLCALVPL